MQKRERYAGAPALAVPSVRGRHFRSRYSAFHVRPALFRRTCLISPSSPSTLRLPPRIQAEALQRYSGARSGPEASRFPGGRCLPADS